MKTYRSNKEPMSKSVALLLIIVGTFLGSVFIFGMNYWNAPIEREDAISFDATFLSYEESLNLREGTRGIDVYFSDYNQLYIDGTCVNDELRGKMEQLSPDTKVSLLVHPNSDTILDMHVNGNNILTFDEVQSKLSGENKGFFVLGLFMYFCALYALCSLATQSKRMYSRRKAQK